MRTKVNKKESKEILKIAMEYLIEMQERGDFESRMNDAEDHIEVDVLLLKTALHKAFLLGWNSKD